MCEELFTDKCVSIILKYLANSRECGRNTHSIIKHNNSLCLIVCLFGFKVAFKLLGSYHNGACCSSDTLTNVLQHRNAMPQTQDMTPHPVTVYRHRT